MRAFDVIGPKRLYPTVAKQIALQTAAKQGDPAAQKIVAEIEARRAAEARGAAGAPFDTKKIVIIGGIAVAAVLGLWFLTKKRKSS